MKYRVRNKDGELEYASLQELQKAARIGFIEVDDEVRRDDETEWKKVGSIASLNMPTRSWSTWLTPMGGWVFLAVSGGIFAAWAIHRGHARQEPELYVFGLMAVFVDVALLFKITADAQKRRR